MIMIRSPLWLCLASVGLTMIVPVCAAGLTLEATVASRGRSVAPVSQHTPVGQPISVAEVADETITIRRTTFRIPKRYVGYYDAKQHSVLSLHFLLPDVIPIEPFSIGAAGGYKATDAADVGVLSIVPGNYSYVDRLRTQGKLAAKNYGFGLRALTVPLFLNSAQRAKDLGVRDFLGKAEGQEVFIHCSGLNDVKGLRSCEYTVSFQDYSLQIDIPFSYLPEWRGVLNDVGSYLRSHEVK